MTYTNYLLSLAAVFGSSLLPSADAQKDIWADYEPSKNWTDNISFDKNIQAVVATAIGKNTQTVGSLTANGSATWVRESGMQFALVGQVRAQSNHSDRPFGGVTATANGQSIALGGVPQNTADDVQVALEIGRLDIKGAWGNVRVGIDRGVGDSFHEAIDQAFEDATVTNAKLHPDKLAALVTTNDISGNLPKVSVETPRWLGVKLGASIAAPAEIHSSYGALSQLQNANVLTVENTPTEFAANYVTQLKDSKLKFRAAASVGHLDAKNTMTGLSDSTQSLAGSAQVDGKNWAIGLAGRRADTLFGAGQYEALLMHGEIHPNKDAKNLKLTGQIGMVKDDALDIEGTHIELGANFQINDKVGVSAGLRNFTPRAGRYSAGFDDQQNIVIEISLRY